MLHIVYVPQIGFEVKTTFFAKQTGCFGRMYDPGMTRSHHCFKKCYVFSLVSCRCLEPLAPLSEGHVIILDSEALSKAVETHLIS